MSFSDPDPADDARPAPPPWLLTTIGGIALVGAVMFFIDIADNAIYFGFSHDGLIWTLALGSWAPAAIATGIAVWRYVPTVRGGATGRVIFGIYTGCMGGALITALISMIATQIDHALLFPATTTRTLADVQAPIAFAYATHGKGHGWFITLPPVSQPLRIYESNYNAMLDARKLTDPALNPDSFLVAGTFCARVTIQLSGRSGRIRDVGTSTLPSDAIHPCPRAYDDVFARIPQPDGFGR